MARAPSGESRVLHTANRCAGMIALCMGLLSLSRVGSRAHSAPAAADANASPTQTITNSPTEAEETPTPTAAIATPTPSRIPAPTDTSTPTAEVSPPSKTATCTMVPSPYPSSSPTPTPAFQPYDVLINEIAWAGTRSSAYDEWIELYNPGQEAIDLTGWRLEDGGDISVSLQGIIAARSLYLLERSDDSTISDMRADRIYTGSLNNGGETLWLKDPSGAIIDTANIVGGAWPAGNVPTRASMERLGGADLPGNWRTWNGNYSVGHDSGGNPIAGTPKHATSLDWGEETQTPTGTTTATSPVLPSTSTSTVTPSSTPAPTAAPAFPPFAVMINEVAWAGTLSSAFDEWIELYNPSEEAIDLTGWILEDGGDVRIALAGVIAPHSLFLLERTSDATISTIRADQLFTGGLNNGGETLWLRDPSGAVIDTANAAGGAWPAGNAQTRASMERRGGSDRPGNWSTWMPHVSAGFDSGGNPIAGTPRQANSPLYPTPTPTVIPSRIVINEVLIRPHYDWNHSGEADLGDEFIELYNAGHAPVDLSGWILDDVAGGGTSSYTIPHKIILPGSRVAFFRSQTHISLNDAGDVIRLLSPDGRLIDQIRYIRVRAYNLSYGRLPDGSSNLAYALWPTPGARNVAFEETSPDLVSTPSDEPPSPAGWRQCPGDTFPWPLLEAISRHPAILRWMVSIHFFVCR